MRCHPTLRSHHLARLAAAKYLRVYLVFIGSERWLQLCHWALYIHRINLIDKITIEALAQRLKIVDSNLSSDSALVLIQVDGTHLFVGTGVLIILPDIVNLLCPL